MDLIKNEIENTNENEDVEAPTTTDDELPLIYKDMTNDDEDVQVMIGPDLGLDGESPHNGKYIAHFTNNTINEQKTAQLDDLNHVNNFRNEISLQGWRLYIPPGMSSMFNKKKTRTQKRYEKRQAEKQEKKDQKRKNVVRLRREKLKKDLDSRVSFAKNIK